MVKLSINIKNTTMIQPSQETPKRRMWVSNLDLLMSRVHPPIIYFYRPNGLSGFFDPNLVKEALGQALILYYPVAGRLRKDVDSQRIEIDCNDEGVLFVEADTTSVLDDFDNFAPTMEYKDLVPSVDCSGEISSFPLFLVQLTYFKCGGVSLGVAMHHLIVDAFSLIRFMNTWGDVARGLEPASLPFLDRTLLRARDPPSPKFHHVEYQPPPTLLTPCPTSATTSKRAFNITPAQINALKANSNQADGKNKKDNTSFEVLSGHIWRCVCKARDLSDTQAVKLYIPVDAKSRLDPNLPPSYFGNAVFMASTMAMAGELVSKPTSYATTKIRESVERMDDEYLRSALDYIELRLDNDVLVRRSDTFQCPNLCISSWAKLPIYDADFGWGRPAYMGPGGTMREGSCNLVPRAIKEEGLSVVITLEDKHMHLFETYFYRI